MSVAYDCNLITCCAFACVVTATLVPFLQITVPLVKTLNGEQERGTVLPVLPGSVRSLKYTMSPMAASLDTHSAEQLEAADFAMQLELFNNDQVCL